MEENIKRVRRSWRNMKMTDQEYNTYKRLVKLQNDWPAECWLSVSAAGTHLMRLDESGKVELIVTVDIPNDYTKPGATDTGESKLFVCDCCGNYDVTENARPGKIYKRVCSQCWDLG
jgi:hypothetical protein